MVAASFVEKSIRGGIFGSILADPEKVAFVGTQASVIKSFCEAESRLDWENKRAGH